MIYVPVAEEDRLDGHGIEARAVEKRAYRCTAVEEVDVRLDHQSIGTTKSVGHGSGRGRPDDNEFRHGPAPSPNPGVPEDH